MPRRCNPLGNCGPRTNWWKEAMGVDWYAESDTPTPPEDPFLLVSGVFGDGSNDYLQVRNSDNSPYTHNTSGGNWTLEYWIKPPTTLTAQEGTYSSNPTNTLVNLALANFFDRVATAGYYFQQFETWNSSSVKIVDVPGSIPLPASNAFRINTHIVITYENTGGGNYKWNGYVNGVPLDIANNTKTSTPASLGFNFLTDRVVAGRFSDGVLMGVRFYSRTLSFSEVVSSYNNGKWSNVIGANCVFDFRLNQRTGSDFADNNGSTLKLTAVNFADVANNLVTPTENPSQIRIVCDGNSMTYGTGTTTLLKAYPKQLIRSINDIVNYEAAHNIGIAGQTTPQIITAYPNRAALCFDTSKSKNIYVPWECTNDLFFGASAATAYSNYVTLCGLARDTGYKVVAVTVLPRSNSGTPGTFEADRQTVNTNIRNNWASFADALADVAANTTIGDAGDETNATYYSDLVHMTDAGYLIVADIIKTAILTIP